MATPKKKWSLADLVDFEMLLARDADSADAEKRDRKIYLETLAPTLRVFKKSERTKVGLLMWLDTLKKSTDGLLGGRLLSGISLIGFIWCAFLLLSGVGVITGLLDRARSGFNVTLFLAVTLGLQWVILLLGTAAWFLRGRAAGGWSVVQSLLALCVRKIAGSNVSPAWERIASDSGRYRAVLVWPLVRIVQAGGVMFNLGLILGLLGCLWFLDVRFFWESTPGDQAVSVLHNIVSWMATPWSWYSEKWIPSWEQVQETRLLVADDGGVIGKAYFWYPFLFASIFVWGLLPRLILWALSVFGQRRSLGSLDFQAPRHRELWRRMTRVERAVVPEGLNDSAVVIDCGGMGASADSLRPFLLRTLRLNPESIFKLSVLDEEEELKTMKAVSAAQGGVVLLVEGWSLSPKQSSALHRRIREHAQKKLSIWFVVMGEKDTSPPLVEHFKQWQHFVDSLEDPNTEAIAYSSENEGGLI